MKGEPKYDDPEVVEKGKTDDRRPPVGETTAGIEYEGEAPDRWSSSAVVRIQIEFLEAGFDIVPTGFP